jgi:apolipoprotein N-acyltransferase
VSRRTPRTAWRYGLAALSGGLLTLAYPPFELTLVAWVGLAPLIVALDGVPARTAAALGWTSGTVLGLGVAGYWLWHAAVDYFGYAAPLATAFTLALIALFVAPFTALFGVVVACAGRRQRWLAAPAAWVGTELLRSAVVGNAWELLGHSQTALPLLQIVDVTGVYGLSFLLALSATAAAEGIIAGRESAATATRQPALVAAAVATTVALAYGGWRLAQPAGGAGTLRASLVQGGVAHADRLRPERTAAVVRRYLELSRSIEPPAPLVLWPENAVAVFPETNAALLAPVATFLRQRSAALLTGAPRAGERAGTAAIYNAVYLVTAAGAQPVYDKRRLLPFVERFPLRPGDGPYLPGEAATPLDVAGARAGTLICFEVIYPDLARRLVADGADVLLNFSNDSWFDAGAGPAQHYAMARFRSIENRVSLLRVTNSGISGAFDPHGRELARLAVGVPAAAAVEVPLHPGGSFYTRHGDWFAGLCLLGAAAAAIAGGRRHRPQAPA